MRLIGQVRRVVGVLYIEVSGATAVKESGVAGSNPAVGRDFLLFYKNLLTHNS